MKVSFELIVFGLIFNLFKIHQDSSCIAPKWQAQPQKNLPKIKVVKNATKTSITPALMIPLLIKEWKNSWKSTLPMTESPKTYTCKRIKMCKKIKHDVLKICMENTKEIKEILLVELYLKY